MMRPTWHVLAGLAVLVFGSTATAQFFTDDLSSGANWTIAQTSDSTFAFGYDYSQDGLPAAPNGSDSIGLKFEVNNNEFGVNLGAGAMGFMTDHVGFRGDIRYFRALSDPVEDNEFDIDFGDFDFWRATGGITFRW